MKTKRTDITQLNESLKKWLEITETDGIIESNVRFVNETSLGRLFGDGSRENASL